jgi:hypothetical protein
MEWVCSWKRIYADPADRNGHKSRYYSESILLIRSVNLDLVQKINKTLNGF